MPLNIAIIGWGSLIWDTGDLKLRTPWHKDGPLLPIEFARISQRNRLTLVLLGGIEKQPTCWALSSFDRLDDARENLRVREGPTPVKNIHGVTHSESIGTPDRAVVNIVREWLSTGRKIEIEAVIWAGLTSNWLDERHKEFDSGNAVAFLQGLDDHRAAEEYIRKAPANVRTEVRQLVEAEFGWTPIPLPDHLFATC